MNSVASRHFPMIVHRDGQRMLWNPLEKKALANRPEERVRLRVVDYLLHEAGVSKSRIKTEGVVKVPGLDQTLRTDVVVFDDRLEALTLVECKAPTLNLKEEVSRQITRYNQGVNAKHLWLTNGRMDAFFDLTANGSVESANAPHPSSRPIDEIRRTPGYWAERGFISSSVKGQRLEWVSHILSILWDPETEWNIGYLDLSRTGLGVDVSHFYRMISIDEEMDLAFSVVSPDGVKTWLVVAILKSQAQPGIVLTDLDALCDGVKENTLVHTINEQSRVDLRAHIPLVPGMMNSMILYNLPGFFQSWFRQILVTT